MKTFNLLLSVFVLFITASLFAQFDLKEKLKEKAANKAETHVDEEIDKGLDKVEEGVGNLFKSNDTDEKTDEDNNDNSSDSNQSDNTPELKDSISTSPASVSLKSFTKYDFIPGDKVLYFEDFSQDGIGDFPALWTTDGGGEVKTINLAAGNWFHMNKEGSFYCYTKTIDFPQNFIVEFDFIPEGDFQGEFEFHIYADENKSESINSDLYPGTRGIQIYMNEGGWSTKGYENTKDAQWLESHSTTNPAEHNNINHIIVWVQNNRIRIYHKGAKALDAPTAIYSGDKFNKIRFSSYNSQCTPYVSSIKVTTAAPDTRSKLITEGKLVSYGIYFDVNKDEVKPESFGTLSDIAKVLKENPSVKIKIIGHTDSDGDDSKNLDLSKRRAASVKNVLSGEFGIDANRIKTDGMGETVPIAPNTTSENKAKNRRVEFIKL